MSKRNKTDIDLSWLQEAEDLIEKTERTEGFLGRILKEPLESEWRPFHFIVHEFSKDRERVISIVEVDPVSGKNDEGCNPVYARLGTLPRLMAQNGEIKEGLIFICDGDYSISTLEGDNLLFLWKIVPK